jgi:hypothetical protein
MTKQVGLTDKQQLTALTHAAESAQLPFLAESQDELRIWIDHDENIFVAIKGGPTGFQADLLFGDAGIMILKKNLELPTEADLLAFMSLITNDDVQDFLLGYVLEAPKKGRDAYFQALDQQFDDFVATL